MKKMMLVTIAILVLLASVFMGCQKAAEAPEATKAQATEQTEENTQENTQEDETERATGPWGALDLSEPETVNFYVVGTLSDDWQMVVDKANEMMQEKINTTVNFIHVPFSDFQSKYALFLAGDEDVDCIYAAAWVNYMDNVKAGAFKPLSEEFIQTYMPLTWENQAPSSWKEASYEGQIYSVPGNRVDVTSSGAVTTQDLLDSVGMTVDDVQDWDGLKTYLLAIAETHSGTGLYGVNPQGSWPSDSYWFGFKHNLFDIDAGSATWMVWDYTTGKDFSVEDLMWWADTDAYLDYALEMAEYNEAGVFPDSVLQSQSFIDDNFLNGKSAINFMTPSQADGIEDQIAANGKELVYLDCGFGEESKTRKGNYMGYGASFPFSSSRTERAAVALDCMKFDEEVHMLLVGGIEGKHYIYDPETNTRTLGPDVDRYPWLSWFYWLQNDSDPSPKLRGEYQEINQHYVDSQVPDGTWPLVGFNYNSSKYSAEIAVLSSIVNEYRFSFCYGVFQNMTEEKYYEFMEKCKAAGLDKIVEDYRAQAQAFIDG